MLQLDFAYEWSNFCASNSMHMMSGCAYLNIKVSSLCCQSSKTFPTWCSFTFFVGRCICIWKYDSWCWQKCIKNWHFKVVAVAFHFPVVDIAFESNPVGEISTTNIYLNNKLRPNYLILKSLACKKRIGKKLSHRNDCLRMVRHQFNELFQIQMHRAFLCQYVETVLCCCCCLLFGICVWVCGARICCAKIANEMR